MPCTVVKVKNQDRKNLKNMSFLQKIRHKRGADLKANSPPVHGEEFRVSFWYKRLPKYVWLFLSFFLVLCVVFLILFFMPRQAAFSYTGETCRTELTLLPKSKKTVKQTSFSVQYAKAVRVRSFELAATSTCFTPIAAPEQGTAEHSTALFGWQLLSTRYRIVVGEPPKVSALVTIEPQPISKPVRLSITQPDKVFQYYVQAIDKTQRCSIEETELMCPFDELGLAQGATHNLKIVRMFEQNKIGEIASADVAILPAVVAVESSIKNDELVYAKPTNMTVSFDKAVVTSEAKLDMLEGDIVSPVEIQTKTAELGVEIVWSQELPREKTFRLSIVSVVATDGSTLAEPYVTTFRTSGGPKITGISIGHSVVAGNARVLVTFDQTLANIDITKLASIEGGAAVITRQKNQIVFALQNIPPCTAFTLRIAKGIVGESGVASTQDWAHASRVNCRTTRVLGYSVRGRPIVAHYYGNGPTTIFFNGGIHGSEPSSTYVMQDWAAHLDSEAYKIPADKQVVIVPSINPDGIANGDRFNANGVNLARNFPTSDWASDIVTSGGPKPKGGGSAPLSEPESKAVANVLRTLRPRVVLSFHSKGSLVGINQYGDSESIGNIYASSVRYGKMYHNAEEVLGYDITGEYETWIGEGLGLPCVLIELPAHTGRYFFAHQNVLWKMVNL